MFTINISKYPSADWDDNLLKGKSASLHLFHSTSWANRLESLLDFEPLYISVKKNDNLSLLLLGFKQPNGPLFSKSSIKRIFKNPAKLFAIKRQFIWYGQPIFFQEQDESSYKFLAESLSKLLIQQKLVLDYGEWPMQQQSCLSNFWSTKVWATLKLDLNSDLENIFSSFKSSARKEINKAERNNVVVKRISNLDELRDYYSFACICSKRYQKNMYGFKDYESMWTYLREWGYFETFAAYENGRLSAGLSIWGDKYSMIEIGSFQSEDSFNNKFGSSDAIKWNVIKWGKSAGLKTYDLAGVNPNPNNEKEIGIKRFKQKWTTNELQYLVLSSKE